MADKKPMSLRKRLESLEKTQTEIKKGQIDILKHLKKMEEEKPAAPEMPMEPAPEDEEKQAPEDEEAVEDEEKSKQEPTIGGNGEGEDVKLPKSSAGETGETAAPETDKVNFVEKVNKAVEDKLKGMGLIKTSTPRPAHKSSDPQDLKKSFGDEFFDMCEKAKKGEISQAELNKAILSKTTDARDKRLAEMKKALARG